MHAWTRRALQAALLSGGALVLAVGVASAEEQPNLLSGIGQLLDTTLDTTLDSVASGNGVDTAVVAPVRVCGISVGLLGSASGSCTDSTVSAPTGAPVDAGTDGAGGTQPSGVASGNGGKAAVTAPVTIGGIAIGNGTASTTAGSRNASGAGGGSTAGAQQTGSPAGVASGNAVAADAQAPVSVCGISVGLLGDASGECATSTSATGGPSAAPAFTTDGVLGFLGLAGSGTDLSLGATAPVQVCGISLGLLGDGVAQCAAATSVADPTDPGTPDPTDPGSPDPTDPGSDDPTDPGSDGPGSGTDDTAGGAGSGGMSARAIPASVLAYTGLSTLPFLAASAIVLAALGGALRWARARVGR